MKLIIFVAMKKITEAVSKLSNYMAQTEEQTKERINASGITQTQMHYIEAVADLANPTITELAGILKITKPTVTVAIDKLVEKECIYRVKSDTDRRSAHLHLTEKGKELNQLHHLAHITIARALIKNLSQEEIDSFEKLVNKIVR